MPARSASTSGAGAGGRRKLPTVTRGSLIGHSTLQMLREDGSAGYDEQRVLISGAVRVGCRAVT